jgi:hypothetical protein
VTASVRLWTPCLPKMWLTCALTVFSDSTSRWAIPLLLAPAASMRDDRLHQLHDAVGIASIALCAPRPGHCRAGGARGATPPFG